MSAGRPAAFSFKSTLERNEIRHKFQQLGSFDWKGADSDTYGLYLWATPIVADWPAGLRMYGETPPDYLLQFNYRWSMLHAGIDPAPVIAFVTDKLLPAIGATDIKPAPSMS
jgi:hypothetical protein